MHISSTFFWRMKHCYRFPFDGNNLNTEIKSTFRIQVGVSRLLPIRVPTFLKLDDVDFFIGAKFNVKSQDTFNIGFFRFWYV